MSVATDSNTNRQSIIFEAPNECRWEFHEELREATVFQRVLFKEVDIFFFSMTHYLKIEGQAAFEKIFVILKSFHWQTIYESYNFLNKLNRSFLC